MCQACLLTDVYMSEHVCPWLANVRTYSNTCQTCLALFGKCSKTVRTLFEHMSHCLACVRTCSNTSVGDVCRLACCSNTVRTPVKHVWHGPGPDRSTFKTGPRLIQDQAKLVQYIHIHMYLIRNRVYIYCYQHRHHSRLINQCSNTLNNVWTCSTLTSMCSNHVQIGFKHHTLLRVLSEHCSNSLFLFGNVRTLFGQCSDMSYIHFHVFEPCSNSPPCSGVLFKHCSNITRCFACCPNTVRTHGSECRTCPNSVWTVFRQHMK